MLDRSALIMKKQSDVDWFLDQYVEGDYASRMSLVWEVTKMLDTSGLTKLPLRRDVIRICSLKDDV